MGFLFNPGKTVRSYFLRTSLKNALLWFFIPIFVLCILVNLFLTNILLPRQVRENALVSISGLVSETRQHLDYRLHGVFEQMVRFERSSDVSALIVYHDEDRIRRGERFIRVFNDLSRIYAFLHSALDSVFVAVQQGDGPIDVFYRSDYPLARSDFCFSIVMNGAPLIEQAYRSYQWFNIHENIISPNLHTDNRVASLYKVLGHAESRSRALFMFNFRNSFFWQIFGRIEIAGNGYMALLGDGVIMDFRAQGSRHEIDSAIIQIIEASEDDAGMVAARDLNGRRILIVWESLQLGHWKLAAIFPESDLLHSVRNIPFITMISSFMAIGIALIFSFFVARHVSGLVEEEQKRKLEIRVLHEQIKPHFLYNALNSIEQLGVMGKYEKMTGSVKALTGFYRLGLSKGQQLIQLKDEISHAEYYLAIQIMHNSRLSYRLQIPPEFLQIQIVKFCLQPVLENAVLHGIKYGEDLHIHISVESAGEDIKITISDNGIGIPNDKLNALQRAFETADWTPLPEVFGIRNVHERIRLQYGPPYGVSIESVFEQGTTVTILTPRITTLEAAKW